MPKKLRRTKVRQSKRKQERQPSVVAAVKPSVVTQSRQPDTSPNLAAPSVSAPALKVKSGAGQNPYVVAELRNIGILFGIIVVILIVLVLVLP